MKMERAQTGQPTSSPRPQWNEDSQRQGLREELEAILGREVCTHGLYNRMAERWEERFELSLRTSARTKVGLGFKVEEALHTDNKKKAFIEEDLFEMLCDMRLQDWKGQLMWMLQSMTVGRVAATMARVLKESIENVKQFIERARLLYAFDMERTYGGGKFRVLQGRSHEAAFKRRLILVSDKDQEKLHSYLRRSRLTEWLQGSSPLFRKGHFAVKVCCECGKFMTLLQQRKEICKKRYDRNQEPRGYTYFPEFRAQMEFNASQQVGEICYQCSKTSLVEAVNERREVQDFRLAKLQDRAETFSLMLGNIHSYIDNRKASVYYHLSGNQGHRLFDGSLSVYLREATHPKNWWRQMTLHQKKRVDEALSVLKQKNHLFGLYMSNYEMMQLLSSRSHLRSLFEEAAFGVDILPLRSQLLQVQVCDVGGQNLVGMGRGLYAESIIMQSEQAFFLVPADLEYQEKILGRAVNIGDLSALSALRIGDVTQIEGLVDTVAKKEQMDQVRNAFRSQALNKIYYDDPYVEEMLFPNLFESGTGGYNSSYKSQTQLTPKQYIKMRLLHCRSEYRLSIDFVFWWYDRIVKESIIKYNRGVGFVRPGSYDSKVKVKDVFKVVGGKSHPEYYGHKLNYKMADSPAYWQASYYQLKRYQEYMREITGRSCPDLFVTFTLNENDAHLKHLLRHRNSLFDPVATVCHFHTKIRQVLKLLYGQSKSRNALVGKAVGYFEKIEFQKRGAPHLHALLWLDEEGLRILNAGDFITARYLGDFESDQLIAEFQEHKCVPERCYKRQDTRVCKFGYPQALSEVDHVVNGRWQYVRCTEKDRTIAPFNLQLLKLYRGNMCIMRMTESDITAYLVKYIAKTAPELNIMLQYPQEDKNKASVLYYLQNRKVSSCNAVWTLLGLEYTQFKHQVKYLDIQLPHLKGRVLKQRTDLIQLDDESEDIYAPSKLDRYYQRPNGVDIYNTTFIEFLEWWDYTLTKSSIPKHIIREHKFMQNEKTGVYYYKRNVRRIMQLRKWYPQDGDVYYYMKFLERVPHKRHNQLSQRNRTKTYMEECFVRDILDDHVVDKTSIKDFWQRANINKRLLVQTLQRMMNASIGDSFQHSKLKRHVDILQEIEIEDLENQEGLVQGGEYTSSKRRMSKSQHTYSQDVQEELSSLRIVEGELDYQPLLVPTLIMQVYEQYLQTYSRSQQFLLGYVINRINKHQQCLLAIQGGAGFGKSFMTQALRVVLEHCMNLNVELAATTGTAASNINAVTLHSLLQMNQKYKEPWIDPHSPFQLYLQNIDAIIVDEVSMLNRENFEHMAKVLEYGETRPQLRHMAFGGKHIILVGDLLQLPPVRASDMYKQSGNSFIQSDRFLDFDWILLDENFRQTGDSKFLELLQQVRTNSLSAQSSEMLKGRVCGRGHQTNEKCAIGDGRNLILVATNEERRKYNKYVLSKLFVESDLHRFQAIDRIKDGDFTRILNPIDRNDGIILRQLNQRSEKLSQEVEVAKGMQMMVLYNVDVSEGLTNGSIVSVVSIAEDGSYLQVQTKGRVGTQFLKRTVLHMEIEGQRVIREQFALTAAYASTIHKVQGQTLENVIIDCKHVYQPGHAYTAFSRVKRLDDLHLVNYDGKCIVQNEYVIQVLESKGYEQKKRLATGILQELRHETLTFLEKSIRRYPSKDVDKIATALSKLESKARLYKQPQAQGYDLEMEDLSELIEGLSLSSVGADEPESKGSQIHRRKQGVPCRNPQTPAHQKNPTQQMQRKVTDEDMCEDSNKELQQVRGVKDSHMEDEYDMLKTHKDELQPKQGDGQDSYPWIKWFANSCLHDSFMTLFFLNVYQKDGECIIGFSKQNQQLLDACEVLKSIDIDETYRDQYVCMRQHGVVQMLRQGNPRISDIQELFPLLNGSPNVSTVRQQRSECGNCGHRWELQQEMIEIIELGNYSKAYKTVDELLADRFQNQLTGCNACKGTNCCYIENHISHKPRHLFIGLEIDGDPVSIEEGLVFEDKGYELTGIVVFKKRHFISYVKNGLLREGLTLGNWWRSDSLDGTIDFWTEGLDETLVRQEQQGETPHLLLYQEIQ